jgi:hypothetical protein
MLLFLVRLLFGLVLSLASVLLLALATWLCLRLIAIAMSLFSERRSQDAAGAVIVLAVTASALVTLYGAGHALHSYMSAWPVVGHAPGWLAGPRLVSPEAILGALIGLGGLAAAPSLWRWRGQLAEARRNQPAPTKPAGKAAEKPARPAKTAKAAAKPAPAPRRPTIPQLGWLALFLLSIGGVLLAFAIIVAPVALAGNLTDTIHRAGRSLPIYICALTLFGCGLLCLLLWRVCRRAPVAGSR